MRKLFVSLLAVAALAACSNEDVVRQPASSAISFDGMFVENATRAEDPSIKTGTLEAFNVWGFMNETTGMVFDGTKVTKMGDMWCYDVPQYWLPGNTYYFAALAPVGGNWALHTENANKKGAGIVDFINVDGSEDLIYASTSVQAKVNENEAVKFTFSHLLSKIKFTFKNGFAHENITVDVKDVKMVAPKSGSIDLAVENWWDNDDWKLTEETFALEFGDVATMKIGASETAAKERLTIPTDAAYAHEVTFTANVWVGDQLTAFEKKAVIEGAAFEMGKAYNLKATISPETLNLEQIVFEVVEVKDWVYSENPFNMSVAESELQAAADLGGEYTLTEDINLTTPLVVTAPYFALNLNGNTITGGEQYVEGAGQPGAKISAIVVDNGANLVINGEVAGSQVLGSSYAVNVINGTATLKGGEYYGEAYPVQAGNKTGEAAVVYIEDGMFHCVKYPGYVLNCVDDAYANGSAKFVVSGGMYKGFNPAQSLAEPRPAAGNVVNWMAPGYTTYQEGEWYVVVRGALISNADEFKAAAKDEKLQYMVFVADVDFGTATATVSTDKVIKGNGYKLIAGGTKSSKNYGLGVSGATVVVEDLVMNGGGGIYANSGANLTINNVTLKANYSGSSRHLFYVNGATLTVNSGVFEVLRTSSCYFTLENGAKAYVKGGTFEDMLEKNYDRVRELTGSKLEISGGKFRVNVANYKFDPTAWLADGYKAERVGDYMEVSAE